MEKRTGMKKKILFIIWSYTMGGGAESLLTSIVNNLNPDKYEIDIIEYHHAKVKTEPVNENIRVLPYIESTRKWIRRAQFLLLNSFPQFLSNKYFHKKYDLYIAFNYLIPSFLLPKHTKNIQWIHSDVYDLAERRQAWNKKKQDKALNKVNKIVVISDYTEQSVKDLFSDHQNKIIKLYNGINIDRIREKALEETDIELNSPAIVFVGRLEDRKNPLRLVDVLKRVHDRGVKVHLYMLGGGMEAERLRQQIIDKAIEYMLLQFVHVLGYLQNPFPVIKQCDAVCLLSKSEGFSMSLLESVALGKPFVSTKVGGANELIDGYGCGYVVETNDEAANAILSLLCTDRNKIAMECEKSISRFEFATYIKCIEGLIDDVINDNR